MNVDVPTNAFALPTKTPAPVELLIWLPTTRRRPAVPVTFWTRMPEPVVLLILEPVRFTCMSLAVLPVPLPSTAMPSRVRLLREREVRLNVPAVPDSSMPRWPAAVPTIWTSLTLAMDPTCSPAVPEEMPTGELVILR